MAILSRTSILTAVDMQTETVAVPEWGGDVIVRGLTGKERDTFEQASLRRNTKGELELNMSNMRARLVAYCVIDDTGARLFTDADIAEIGKKSAAALERIAKVAQRLSGMGSEAAEKAAEDFFDAPNADSTTA